MEATQSPACTHAYHFANGYGQLTYDSIMRGQKKWGITGAIAHVRALAVLAMCGNEKTPEGLCKVVNKARSGIWDTEGKFNEEQFNKLKAQAVELEDKTEVITLSIFKDFLADLHGTGYSGIMVNVWVKSFICIPITYYQVTDGSVSDFFDKFSDCTYEGKKAISLDKLHSFYTTGHVAAPELQPENK